MESILTQLKTRGFIESVSDESLYSALKHPVKLYCGFDPTGESLHVGHLIPILGLVWFQKAGHTPYPLVGGATGMIGDPSGKSKERNLLDEATIQKNVGKIADNLQQLLSFEGDNAAILLNNHDWFKTYHFIPFLREVGKLFRMGPMLAKDSVKLRLESEEGMSFTEFCYQVLQGYDFLHLYRTYGVTLQMGGSDQWGNITAGCELVRKAEGAQVHGITFPLLTRSDGKKFGKTEEGAVWLSKEKTSPYDFYQYFYRIPDADVIRMLNLLTFIPQSDIKEIGHRLDEPNYAQKILAREVTELVHGEEGVKKALQATQLARPGQVANLNREALQTLKRDLPYHALDYSTLVQHPLIDILVRLELQKSKGEARRLVKNGGLYLNNEKIVDDTFKIQEKDFLEDKFLLVSIGKKNRVLIQAKNL